MTYVLIALAVYQLLAHLTVLVWKMPKSHNTYFGFGVALLFDMGTNGALWLYSGATDPDSPWRYVFLAGWLIHLSYVVLYFFIQPVYQQLHDISAPSIYADNKFVAGKFAMVVIDSITYAIGVAYLFATAHGPVSSRALAAALAALVYVRLYWGKTTVAASSPSISNLAQS